MPENRIRIEGESVTVVRDFREHGPGVAYVDLEDGTEWVLAEDEIEAGKAAREYWENMAQDDSEEFTCMVGEATLVAWGLGQWAGPGSTSVQSLSDWLDLWLDTPEEHFASYDGYSKDVKRVGRLADDLGWTPTVAYRHN